MPMIGPQLKLPKNYAHQKFGFEACCDIPSDIILQIVKVSLHYLPVPERLFIQSLDPSILINKMSYNLNLNFPPN